MPLVLPAPSLSALVVGQTMHPKPWASGIFQDLDRDLLRLSVFFHREKPAPVHSAPGSQEKLQKGPQG